jgi:hypothetical protein
MSRYVYEVQPYHTARELEMDRIMKAKYQKKFFSKREKKEDEIPTRKRDVVQPMPTSTTTTAVKSELSVPENEPFRRAFAVNGLKEDPTVEKPVRNIEIEKVTFIISNIGIGFWGVLAHF